MADGGRSIGRVFLVLILALLGCGDSTTEWAGSISSVADIPEVRNPEQPLGEEGALSLREEWSFAGPETGAEIWVEPTHVTLGTNALVVTDPKSFQVHRVGLDGSPLASVGRRGGGPGEFERPEQAVSVGETLWVVEAGGGTVDRIGPNGRSVGTTPTRGLVFDAGVWGDSILVQRYTQGTPSWWVMSESGYERELVIPDSEPLQVDEGEPCSRVSAHGRSVFVMQCRALRWRELNEDGEVRRFVVTPVLAPEITEAQMDVFLGRVRSLLSGSSLPPEIIQEQIDKARDTPSVQRAYQKLVVDGQAGLVLIWEQMPFDFGEEPGRLHAFSMKGIYLASTQLAEPWIDLAAEDGRIYALVLDSDTGLRRLVSYRLELPTSLTRDAARLVDG